MKAVFIDIDGTLATELDVPASAAEGIRKLRQSGALVFICTGRSMYYVRRYFGQYADGFICNNGRLAVMGEEVLYDHPIERERIDELTAIAESCGNAVIWYGRDEGWFYGSDEEYEQLRNDEQVELINRHLSEDMKAYCFNMYFHQRQTLYETEKALEGKCVINPHGPLPHADVTVLGHDKGSALKTVRKALKIRKKDTFAFGDGVNDLSMFAAAGYGVAMGNGSPRLKEKADFITTGIDDDGLLNGLIHCKLI
ncbi:MAG: HAD family hydrolase [Erysipelotrichaceae bacterium]|nr:HAD family hydrolase [Erysipelotrichaceae bacterium]